MNKTYLEQLKTYLDNISKEMFEKEYKKYAYLNNIGPYVFEYIKSIKHFH